MRVSRAAFVTLFRQFRADAWAILIQLVLFSAGATGPSLAQQSESGLSAVRRSNLSLPYTTTNADAGARARYGLLFPLGVRPQQAVDLRHPAAQTWILRFDAELDVEAFQRRLRLCYATARSGRPPAHSRCVEEIAADVSISVGPGEDEISLTTQKSIELGRTIGVWVDLINPISAGFYPVELQTPSSEPEGVRTQTLGFWMIRVEQPGFDGPGSAE